MDIVTSNSKYVSKQLGITSEINYGESFTNIFYKENSVELFLYKEKPYDIINLDNEWRKYRPINCIYSEETDIDFYILNNTKSLPYPMLFVYEIDPVIMLAQYRGWCIERLRDNKSTNPNVFVYTILFPDIMETMLDFTIFNRFRLFVTGLEPPKFKIMHPFNILDLTHQLDEILNNIKDDVVDTTKPLPWVLSSIPCIVNKNVNDLLKLPYSYITAQNEWLYWLNRIFIINDTLSILGDKGIKANRDIISKLRYEMRRIENRSTNLESRIPDDIFIKYLFTIDDIKRKIDKV
jgi:hypothetical protein